MSPPLEVEIDNYGPFDPDELVRWAEHYGEPEQWAKKAQQLHAKLDSLETEHARIVEELGTAYREGYLRFKHLLREPPESALLGAVDPEEELAV